MDGNETLTDQEQRRVFILTSGRTGSTLLAAILADAGAEFGMNTPEQWDPVNGALEHPELRRVSVWMGYAYDLAVDRPGVGPRRYLWDFYRSMGKSHLRNVLRVARYVKGPDADFAVLPAFKMGYFPTIVVCYREFEPFAISSGLKRGHSSRETLVKYYNRIYGNGLLFLRMFGGCVASYSDLTDRNSTAWATALGQATGLSTEKLLASRDRRVSVGRPIVSLESSTFDETAQRTYSAIDGLAGRVLPPSPQALRIWERKCADGRAGVRRSWIERVKVETETLWKSACDRRVSWYARAVVPLCAVAYMIAPIDPIPDRIPVIGHLDDLIVGALLVALFIWLMPSSIKHQHRSAAAERQRRRVATT